jgi:hypothetical protein
MKKTKLLWIVTIIVAMLALASIAADGGRKFTTNLTGAAEVPGPGDPDGSGTASLSLNPGTGEVCWEISVTDIGAPTAAHIHVGAEGVAGGVVVPLLPVEGGCVDVDRSLILNIIQHPEEYYVNVHNDEYPPGALRGQLSK